MKGKNEIAVLVGNMRECANECECSLCIHRVDCSEYINGMMKAAADIIEEMMELMSMCAEDKEAAEACGDKVNHPEHYQGSIECIDYIDSLGLAKGFCLGNAVKYIHRAGQKGGESERDDLEKAAWYIRWYLQKAGV